MLTFHKMYVGNLKLSPSIKIQLRASVCVCECVLSWGEGGVLAWVYN